jgi:hypothetical protein
VSFASAASASAVCSFCRSTLVRDGEALKRIGVSAELFDDHSPLQLGASGQRQGITFTLIGRLQYAYEGGTWNEWHALFDNGRSAWLSEDNGAYVMAFDAPLPADAPALAGLRAGQRCRADGRHWDVASVVRARLIAAQGELPSAPRLEGEFTVVDLRNAQGEVATLDGAEASERHWSVGGSVALTELRLQGLREVSEKSLASRAIECPSCGASLQPMLASTQSLSCEQCRAVVDISKGVGAELAHYAQNNSGAGGLEPQLPLGRGGKLALGSAEPLPWTVVGYMERCDLPGPGSEDEQVFWREYLLYNPHEGFAFLVDSEDGWSWMKPLTGAPELRGKEAIWQGRSYRRQHGYEAKVTWVQGEFYWRVQREERAQVIDFAAKGGSSPMLLAREQTVGSGSGGTGSTSGTGEVTWSGGDPLAAELVADAFSISAAQRAALQRDAAPLTSTSSFADLGAKWAKLKTVFIVAVVLFFVVAMLTECSGDGCDDERRTFGAESAEVQQCLARSSGSRSGSRGGSFGGYSSGGGGHK